MVFCNRKLMRTDIFFTRTTKPICNFVNPVLVYIFHPHSQWYTTTEIFTIKGDSVDINTLLVLSWLYVWVNIYLYYHFHIEIHIYTMYMYMYVYFMVLYIHVYTNLKQPPKPLWSLNSGQIFFSQIFNTRTCVHHC